VASVSVGGLVSGIAVAAKVGRGKPEGLRVKGGQGSGVHATNESFDYLEFVMFWSVADTRPST
jgi:threonine dehydratase